MQDVFKWLAGMGVLAFGIFGGMALIIWVGTDQPTGETIVYRTDRLPLPCVEVSDE